MRLKNLKILLTGPFGNVGLSTLKELIKRNYDVRVFDIKNKKNRRISTKFKHQVEIIWGDLRNQKEIEKAGFKFKREIYTELIHDDNMVKGYILNFRRC